MADEITVNIEGDDITPEDLGRGGLKLLQHKDCYSLILQACFSRGLRHLLSAPESHARCSN